MNAEYIAKSLEAIKVTQYGEETIPLQEFADFIRQQQAEIEKWEEINDRQTRSIKNKQAEIEALRQQVKHLESQVYGGTTK